MYAKKDKNKDIRTPNTDIIETASCVVVFLTEVDSAGVSVKYIITDAITNKEFNIMSWYNFILFYIQLNSIQEILTIL